MTFQLENYLLEKGIVTKEGLEKATAEKNRAHTPILDTLEHLKLLDKKSVIEELEKKFRTKYVDIASFKLEPDIVRLIPENTMKRFMVLALELNKNVMSVAMVDPFDIMAIDNIRAATGYDIKPFLTTEDEFRSGFEKFYLEIFAERAIGKVKIDAPAEVLNEDIFKQISDDNKESVIITLFNAIITQAVRARATDIHIEPQEKDLLIRFRVDGLLHTVQLLPKKIQPLLSTRVKVLAEMDIAETRLPQDGQIRIISGGRDLDLRISTMPGLYGEKFAIRVLDKSSFAFGLSQLGMPPEMQGKFEDYIFRTSGIILVTGPTGSGKTTTLYSTLSRIRSPEKNILTIEDPIEYELLSGSSREGGITQVQVHTKIGLTFDIALRSFLRQDPDIIMVGEIRDKVTADIAITASMVGRLVLSSLHTTDTISSVTRLLNMGIEPYMVGHSLICTLSQRLLRTLCPYCKKQYDPPQSLLQRMGIADKKTTFFREVGCPKCGNTGYIGRIGVFELLPMSDAIKALILIKASEEEIYQAAKKEGFRRLSENAMEFVLNGSTTVSEVLRIAPEY